jgi:hypothetical protein
VPFSYYDRLSARAKAIYRRSDAIVAIRLERPELLQPLVGGLEQSLASEIRAAVEVASGHLARGITEMLQVRPVAVQVLAARPRSDWGELHGLYTPGPERPRLQLWMRTARHKRVVAFRTFLRTLLHELGHHLDYEHLRLEDSLHTEGFFKRESSLFRQLVPDAPAAGDLS